jgi:hypothetical protein
MRIRDAECGVPTYLELEPRCSTRTMLENSTLPVRVYPHVLILRVDNAVYGGAFGVCQFRPNYLCAYHY